MSRLWTKPKWEARQKILRRCLSHILPQPTLAPSFQHHSENQSGSVPQSLHLGRAHGKGANNGMRTRTSVDGILTGALYRNGSKPPKHPVLLLRHYVLLKSGLPAAISEGATQLSPIHIDFAFVFSRNLSTMYA